VQELPQKLGVVSQSSNEQVNETVSPPSAQVNVKDEPPPKAAPLDEVATMTPEASRQLSDSVSQPPGKMRCWCV